MANHNLAKRKEGKAEENNNFMFYFMIFILHSFVLFFF